MSGDYDDFLNDLDDLPDYDDSQEFGGFDDGTDFGESGGFEDEGFGFGDDDSFAESGQTTLLGDEESEDEFDQLRRRSARTGTLYDELESEGTSDSSGGLSSFALSNFSPAQRVILALLVLLDFLIIGLGLLVVAGVISL